MSPTLPSPILVGRERELAALRDCLDAALAGHGSLVLIGGESGIGKTTIAEAVCREAADRGALVLVGRCYDLTETPPYGPWVGLFAHYRPGEGMPPLPEAFATRGTVGAVGDQPTLFHQVIDFFAALAAQHPIALLLDDLHWADPASLDLLRFLARSLDAVPLLALATYRSDELTRHHPLYALMPTLVRESRAERLDLPPLEADAVRALVAARYDLPEGQAGKLAAYVHARAEGNALYLSELLRTLEEGRIIARSERGWRMRDLHGVGVPPLLRQVIEGRLARLGDGARLPLEWAAIIGHDVPLDVWAAVAGGCDALLEPIERAMDARLVDAAPDGTGVRFVHALIREAIYEGILPMRRQERHRLVGEALSALPDPDPDGVAYHFQRAGDARAGEWLVRAGVRAQRAYAYLTAAERFEAALGVMTASHAPDGERGWLMYHTARLRRYTNPDQGVAYLDEAIRVAAAIADRALDAHARFDRGLLQCFAGSICHGLIDMAAGVAALQALTPMDRGQAGRYVPGPFDDWGEHFGEETLALWLSSAGRFAESRARAGDIVAAGAPELSNAAIDGSLYGDACAALAQADAALGLPDAARRGFARARQAYEAAGHHLLMSGVSFTELQELAIPYDADRPAERERLALAAERALGRATAVSGTDPRSAHLPLLFLEGKWTEVRQLAQMVQRGPDPTERLFLGTVASMQGDGDLAWELVAATFPSGAATEPGDTMFLPALGLLRVAAMMALDVGDHGTARRWLEAHDRWLSWSDAVLGRADAALGWATYCRAMGEARGADWHARAALAHAAAPRQPLALLAAHRLLGQLATDAGRFDAAATHVEQSLALADACAAPYERALTLLALAELDAATGRRAEAGIALDEVRAICIPLDTKPTLDRVDALEARLADLKDAPPANPAGLSAREVEVLRLVAAGRSNREIADALFLSPHTVRIHVTHILEKTNTANRAAAAAFAQRHGLT